MSGRYVTDQRQRFGPCEHQFRQRHGRPHRRCYKCGALNPDWSILTDPRIDRTGECWLWTGPRTAAGYGRFGDEYAHRLAWEETHSVSAEGFEVMHKCDNPPCINPAHLRLGTHRENMLDAWAKGLFPKPPGRGAWTHCIRGHEFTPENTLRTLRGIRECRICRRNRALARRKAQSV